MDWMPPISKSNLRELVAAWLVILVLLIWAQWRNKRSAGLPLGYALNLSLIHLTGAFIYCFDYYVPRDPVLLQSEYQLKFTYLGFWVSLIGFLAFCLGSCIVPIVFRAKPLPQMHRHWPQVREQLPSTLLLMAILFFLLGPIMRRIPSLASVSVVGTNLAVAAVALLTFVAVARRDRKKTYGWMASTMSFPLLTTVFLGFAGYGITAAVNAWGIIFRFFRPKVLGVIILICSCTAGITGYVNYMRERGGIRDSVWGAQSFTNRLSRMARIITRFETFNPYQQEHLEIIDVRLNQNDLVGRSVEYITSNRVQYAEGGTLQAAAVSWIPRILWPNKPKTGGSGSLVSRYTGRKFADGTSIGVGQIMEFYINWGIPSVFIGMAVLGFMMGYVDQRAAAGLNSGDFWTFTRWCLPGLGMVQPGGALSELVGTTAAAFVLVTGLHWWMFSKYYETVNWAPRQARGSKNSMAG